jgi:hypothetical protein
MKSLLFCSIFISDRQQTLNTQATIRKFRSNIYKTINFDVIKVLLAKKLRNRKSQRLISTPTYSVSCYLPPNSLLSLFLFTLWCKFSLIGHIYLGPLDENQRKSLSKITSYMLRLLVNWINSLTYFEYLDVRHNMCVVNRPHLWTADLQTPQTGDHLNLFLAQYIVGHPCTCPKQRCLRDEFVMGAWSIAKSEDVHVWKSSKLLSSLKTVVISTVNKKRNAMQ